MIVGFFKCFIPFFRELLKAGLEAGADIEKLECEIEVGNLRDPDDSFFSPFKGSDAVLRDEHTDSAHA